METLFDVLGWCLGVCGGAETCWLVSDWPLPGWPSALAATGADENGGDSSSCTLTCLVLLHQPVLTTYTSHLHYKYPYITLFMALFATDLYSFNCPDHFLQSSASSGCPQDLGYIEKSSFSVGVAECGELCPGQSFIGFISYQDPYFHSWDQCYQKWLKPLQARLAILNGMMLKEIAICRCYNHAHVLIILRHIVCPAPDTTSVLLLCTTTIVCPLHAFHVHVMRCI